MKNQVYMKKNVFGHLNDQIYMFLINHKITHPNIVFFLLRVTCAVPNDPFYITICFVLPPPL